MKNVFSRRHDRVDDRAQAMVEFAIVAPILMLLLIGIFEVGRMVLLYAAVTNAGREAVRYGSAVGFDETGVIKYKNCKGIRELAQKASYFGDAVVEIGYDNGPNADGTNPTPTLCTTDVYSGYLTSGNRIMVRITAEYAPYTRIIPWGPRQITSTSYRTILGYVSVSSGTGGGSGGGGSTGGPTSTPTATEDPFNPWTPTPTVTEGPSPTPTETATATEPGAYMTFTPLATATNTGTPTGTATRTFTPTITFTPTNTFTPTSTPTIVPGCDQIVTGSILLQGTTMTMTIRNPHGPVTVNTVYVKWNAAAGGPAKKPLILQNASLGGIFWTGLDSSGELTITPASEVIIPGNNAISTITFTFDKNYVNPLTTGTETIIITLSTPGCEGITIRRP